MVCGFELYFKIQSKSKLWIDVACVYNFEIYNDNSIVYQNTYGSYGGYGSYGYGTSTYAVNLLSTDNDYFDFKSGFNCSLGVGYQFNERFSLALKYNSKRAMLKENSYWKSDMSYCSLMLGYSL